MEEKNIIISFMTEEEPKYPNGLARNAEPLKSSISNGRIPCPEFCLNIINAAPKPIFVYDDSGRFLIANRSFCDTFDVCEELLLQEDFTVESFPNFRIQNDSWRDEDVFKGGRLEYTQNYTDERDNLLWFEVVKNPIEISNGSYAILCILTDITSLKRTEAELTRSLKKETKLNMLKSLLINAISHDFKTPLTVILSAAEITKYLNNSPGGENMDEYLDKIKTAVIKMDSMIENLLRLNRAENNNITPLLNIIDIKSFCEGLIEEIKTSHKKQGEITLEINNTSQIQVIADEHILRHVLINILSNAVKFSKGGYNVTFEVHVSTDVINFNILDKGIGIDPDEIPNLFDTFYRAGNTSGIPGNGLGLSIVKKFTELHGGTLAVRSSQNDGTAFFISIPMPKALCEGRSHEHKHE
ncbi:MAG TPA: hypothetical protein DC017_18580 [Candidatus Wallbacteria bacterium]|nr:hypothetical protein [Candidatus Wallbacteria bacterium]